MFERADHRFDFTHKVFRQSINATAYKSLTEAKIAYCRYALSLPADYSLCVQYVIHSTVSSGMIVEMYGKLSEWGDDPLLKCIAADSLSYAVEENNSIISGLVSDIPLDLINFGMIGFFADELGSRIAPCSATITLFDGLSDVFAAHFSHTDEHSQLLPVLIRFEKRRRKIALAFSHDNYAADSRRLYEYLKITAFTDPTKEHMHEYMFFTLGCNCDDNHSPRCSFTDNDPYSNPDRCLEMLGSGNDASTSVLRAKAILCKSIESSEHPLFADESSNRNLADSIEQELLPVISQLKDSRASLSCVICLEAADLFRQTGNIYSSIAASDSDCVSISEKLTACHEADISHRYAFDLYSSVLDISCDPDEAEEAFAGAMDVLSHQIRYFETLCLISGDDSADNL